MKTWSQFILRRLKLMRRMSEFHGYWYDPARVKHEVVEFIGYIVTEEISSTGKFKTFLSKRLNIMTLNFMHSWPKFIFFLHHHHLACITWHTTIIIIIPKPGLFSVILQDPYTAQNLADIQIGFKLSLNELIG